MTKNNTTDCKQKRGITGVLSGELDFIIFQKNGRIKVKPEEPPKRKRS